uniref:HotDog ACOT-type domain-containing protein n=1 Tax=Strongyloides stercoralis TaxID=6248 RepID=A0A0K0EIT8_STRER
MKDMRKNLHEHVVEVMKKFKNCNSGINYNLKEYNQPIPMTKTNLKFRIPLSEDALLREEYKNSYGKISIPRMLYEIDYIPPYVGFYFGDNIVFNEAKEKKIITVPRMLTTLFFGDILITRTNLDFNKDIIFDTFIPYSNKSSFIVLLRGYQQDKNNNFSMFFDSKIIMVSRDYSKKMKDTMALPEMVLENENEKNLFNKYKKFLENYKLESKKSLIKSLPNNSEFELMYSNILSTFDKNMLETYEYQKINSDEIQMTDTIVESCFYVTSKEVNYAQFLYGGEIISKGSKLGEVTAAMYADNEVEMVYIGDMRFINPAYIGDIIKIKSMITYVEKPYISVKTNFISSYINSSKKPVIIGYLNMIFKHDGNKQLKKLILHKTNELMAFIEGKRNLEKFKNLKSIL